MSRKNISINGIKAKIAPIGIGYVVIPNDLDRDKYVKKCIQNEIVCIRTERGDFFKDVEMSVNLIQHIIFPEKYGMLGTPVIYNVLPNNNKPFIVGIHRNKKIINNENQQRIISESIQSKIDMNFLAQDSSLVIALDSALDDKGVIKIVAKNKNDTALIEHMIKGFFKVLATEGVSIASKKEIKFSIVDKDLKETAYIKYNVDKGFTLKDEYDNFITTRDGKISIGSEDESAEAGVLGDTLKKKLEELIDNVSDMCDKISDLSTACIAITVPTPVGPSGPPANAAQFTVVNTQIVTIKSKLDNVKNNLKSFLSELLTLD